MGTAILMRTEYSREALLKLAKRAKNGEQARRLLALAAVAGGAGRLEAARIGGVGLQTLRDWVICFNKDGPDGLLNRKRRRKRRLNDEQLAEIKELIIKGPDLEKDHVVRWRCVDIQAIIKQQYSVEYHERTIGKLLHFLGLSHISSRPQHPKSNPQRIETFKKLHCRGETPELHSPQRSAD